MNPGQNTSSSATEDRRRRNRVSGSTLGWLMPDSDQNSDPWEIRVRDVSRNGVGFESSEGFASGKVMRIRIGRGPLELARRVRIVRCNPGQAGTFTVGGEFL